MHGALLMLIVLMLIIMNMEICLPIMDTMNYMLTSILTLKIRIEKSA